MSEARELFDLYDAEGHALGRAKARDDVHRVVFFNDTATTEIYTSEGRLLFQQRAPDKDTWPGRLDASVGGHYRAGEGLAGVVREAHEELSIDVDPDELVPLGVRRVVSLEPGVIDREIQDIYLVRRDLPLTAYQPDPDEIDGLGLIDAGEAARLHAGTIEQAAAEVLPRGAAATETRTITPADLIPGRGDYLAALARAVADVLAGRAPQGLPSIP